jgi:hypothetical protein
MLLPVARGGSPRRRNSRLRLNGMNLERRRHKQFLILLSSDAADLLDLHRPSGGGDGLWRFSLSMAFQRRPRQSETKPGLSLEEINRRWLARRRIRSGTDGGAQVYFGGEGGEGGGEGGGGD